MNGTVSDDVDSFQCHAGVSEETLKTCGNVLYLYSDDPAVLQEIFEPHDQYKYPQGMTYVTYYMPVKSNSVNIRLQEINMLKDETIVVSSNRQKHKDKTDTVSRKSAAHALGCGEGTHTR